MTTLLNSRRSRHRTGSQPGYLSLFVPEDWIEPEQLKKAVQKGPSGDYLAREAKRTRAENEAQGEHRKRSPCPEIDFLKGCLATCVQTLEEWCRRWDQPWDRLYERGELQDAAIEWLIWLCLNEDWGITSYARVCAELSVKPETLRERIVSRLNWSALRALQEPPQDPGPEPLLTDLPRAA